MASPLLETNEILSAADYEDRLTFPEAIAELMEGRLITREEWDNKNEYGLLKDGILMIFTKGKHHKWIVSDGDLMADDWLILR